MHLIITANTFVSGRPLMAGPEPVEVSDSDGRTLIHNQKARACTEAEMAPILKKIEEEKAALARKREAERPAKEKAEAEAKKQREQQAKQEEEEGKKNKK